MVGCECRHGMGPRGLRINRKKVFSFYSRVSVFQHEINIDKTCKNAFRPSWQAQRKEIRSGNVSEWI